MLLVNVIRTLSPSVTRRIGPGPHLVVAERLDRRVDGVDLPLDLVDRELEHLGAVGVDARGLQRLVPLGDHRELGVVEVGPEHVVEERRHPQRTGEVADEPADLDLAVDVVLGPARGQVGDRRRRRAGGDGARRLGRGRRRRRRGRRAGCRAEAPARRGRGLAGGDRGGDARDPDDAGRAEEPAPGERVELRLLGRVGRGRGDGIVHWRWLRVVRAAQIADKCPGRLPRLRSDQWPDYRADGRPAEVARVGC